MRDATFVFKVGQIFRAEIIEVLAGQALICGFDGKLLRVRNASGKLWHIGDRVDLEVVSSNPLQFRVYEAGQSRHRSQRHLRVDV